MSLALPTLGSPAAAAPPVPRAAGARPIPSEKDPAMGAARQAVRLRQFEKAVSIWEEAARRGNPSAAYQLGVAYRTGRGVAKDLEKAVGWFERAADAGDPDAQFALGLLSRSGLGVPRNPDRALELIGKAARAGHTQAAETLARMRKSGSIAYSAAGPRVAVHRMDPREALLQAIRLNDTGAVREAIARGAPVNGAPDDAKNPRPLVLAVESERPELLRILLENRADPNLPSQAGEPPLILAVRSRNPGLIRPLLIAGASANVKSRSGLTALMEAARGGRAEVVDLLLSSGADPRGTSADGSSAADLARRAGHPEIARRLQRKGSPMLDTTGIATAEAEVARSGPKLPESALPPVIEAARRGDHDLLRQLLTRKGALETRDAEGDTALHRAADGGHDDCVALLLAAGTKPDVRGHEQATALMRAIASIAAGADKVVDRLIAAGADPNARDAQGATAFHHAARGATPGKIARLRAGGPRLDGPRGRGNPRTRRRAGLGRRTLGTPRDGDDTGRSGGRAVRRDRARTGRSLRSARRSRGGARPGLR